MKARVRKALRELKKVKLVAREGYTRPGGYELFVITADGALLCNGCCKSEFRQLAYDSFNACDTGWRFVAIGNASNLEHEDFINEHPEGYSLNCCDNCNRILNP